jgi:hypothetical protein
LPRQQRRQQPPGRQQRRARPPAPRLPLPLQLRARRASCAAPAQAPALLPAPQQQLLLLPALRLPGLVLLPELAARLLPLPLRARGARVPERLAPLPRAPPRPPLLRRERALRDAAGAAGWAHAQRRRGTAKKRVRRRSTTGWRQVAD